jgi:hypothetical protein
MRISSGTYAMPRLAAPPQRATAAAPAPKPTASKPAASKPSPSPSPSSPPSQGNPQQPKPLTVQDVIMKLFTILCRTVMDQMTADHAQLEQNLQEHMRQVKELANSPS